MSTNKSLPRRMFQVERCDAAYEGLAWRLAPYLFAGDPLADRAVQELWSLPMAEQMQRIEQALSSTPTEGYFSLRDLVAEAAKVPPWVDWTRVNRAGRIFYRAGVLGGLVLGLKSLVYGYAAPAGNKPLALSGALTTQAERRLAETGRFVSSVCDPDSMRPGGDGFNMTVKVRLMHARVRALCRQDARWNEKEYGTPINQHDMMATLLLFSCVFVDGVRQLGVVVTEQEADDFQHLFRWVGHVIGVDHDLLASSYDEAERLARFVRATQGPADDDSRALVNALLSGPLRQAKTQEEQRRARRQFGLASGLCRSLIDDELAEQLGLQGDLWRLIVPGVKATVTLLEALRTRILGLDDVVESLGQRYWNFNVAQGLAGAPARFYLPESLLQRM